MNLAKQTPRWLAALALAATIFAPGIASADIQSFDLTVPNDAISPYPAPYVHVTVNQSGNTATFTFTADTSHAGLTYLMGDGSSAAVNVNDPGPTVTAISPASLSQQNPPGTSNVNGFGLFNVVLDNADGNAQATSTLSFTVTKATGTWTGVFSGATPVLVANATGAFAASHLFVREGTSTDATATGYVANGGAVEVVPEPTPVVLALMGLGTLGLAGLRRHRNRALKASA